MPYRPDIQDVIDAIYDASADPQRWGPALQKIGDRFDGSPAIIWLQSLPERPTFSAISRLDPDLQPLFFNRYATPQTNPAIPFLLRAVPGRPFDFVARMGGREAFHRTEIYADLFAPQRIWSRAAAMIFKDQALFAPFVLQGPIGCEPLTSAEGDELAFILTHVARALRVTARLHQTIREHDGLLAAIDCIGTGIILVDAAGKIMRMNRAAESIVRSRDGLSVKSGRLVASRASEQVLLERLIAGACAPARLTGGAVGISRPSESLRYGIEVSALSMRAYDGAPTPGAAIIFLTDPEQRPQTETELLAAVFGLTPAEARVAVAAISHAAIGRTAAHLKLSPNTVKSHLRRIFAKTGTGSQIELARLLTSLGLRAHKR
ncbi:hypothetical protein [Bradyrhizobium sp. STM 3562]|uniref:helix-turn-helix transcriptional regulator n=1 Tax=Bradyrhizobium sp. STM 3562 TaxID=578924 RepID=UPI00388D9161